MRLTRRQWLFAAAAALPYKHHVISSENQAYDNSLRVLVPERKAVATLYVLPVNADISHRWGDGFDTLAASGLHEKYGFVLAAPTFTQWPWFADHPVNKKVRQESYFVKEVVPLVDRLYPTPARLLVGFSKSGNGALQLLLRHPELFHAAAAWDAPLMKAAPDQYNMGEIYGTLENFRGYAIPGLLERQAAVLAGRRPRIALLGYDAFQEHTAQAHALMDRLGIPHHYENSTRRAHRWDSGWLAPALAYLAQMV